jgi:hypothetical protein
MTQTDQQLFEGRLAALERAARFSAYARFYGPMAVLALALSFMPLFDDVVEGDVRMTYGSLWEMAGRPGGGPAVLGVLLLLALVGLLAIAAFGRCRPGLLIATAADAALIVLMLLAKPGTGTPAPSLSGSGQAGLVIALCAMALTITHAVHLSVHERRD